MSSSSLATCFNWPCGSVWIGLFQVVYHACAKWLIMHSDSGCMTKHSMNDIQGLYMCHNSFVSERVIFQLLELRNVCINGRKISAQRQQAQVHTPLPSMWAGARLKRRQCLLGWVSQEHCKQKHSARSVEFTTFHIVIDTQFYPLLFGCWCLCYHHK